MGYAAEQRLLAACGADVHVLNGCCGMAGNFGMERGHYESRSRLPNTHSCPRCATPDAVLVADGFSCRTQAADSFPPRGCPPRQILAREH